MRPYLSLASLLLLAACLTEPDPTLEITGTILSADSDTPIAGAAIVLLFQAIFDPQILPVKYDTTGVLGRFSMVIGPPPGSATPSCETLRLAVSAPGYSDYYTFLPIGTTDDPDCRGGVFEVPPIRLSLITPP